jgi:hypothetical protein
MINSLWSHIKKFHSKRTGIPEEIVEYIAVFEILRLCVTGISNTTISEMLELEEYYVKENLIEYLDYPGFSANLSFSPYRFYKVARGNFELFMLHVMGTHQMTPGTALLLHTICDKVSEIESEITDYE